MNLERLPVLAVITGRPGAGKSTLAYLLSHSLGWPVVSRDEIKERLMDSTEDVALAAYRAFFKTIEAHLQQGVSVVAEAAFQHSRWAPKLEPLMSLCDLRLVICELSPQLALERMIERERLDPGRAKIHPLPTSLEPYEPPNFDVPTLVVDTTDGYVPCLQSILASLD